MRSWDIKFELLLLFRFIKWPVITFLGFLFFIEGTGRCISIGFQYAAANIDSETSGKIISSATYSMGKGGVTKRHKVVYQYEVDGVTYTSKIIDYEDITTNASSKVKQYYMDKNVSVFYDSSNPDFSVLEITPLSWSVIIMLLIAVLTPLIVVIWQVDWKQKANKKR